MTSARLALSKETLDFIILDTDGDNFEIEDDDDLWTFTLHVDGDDLSYEDIEDPEVFGQVGWTPLWDEDGKRHDRPADFTGAAVKLHLGNNHPSNQNLWYEPPKELRKFKGSGFDTLEGWNEAKALNLRYVTEILMWGYVHISVTLTHERADGYTHEWRSPGLGGVEAMAEPSYIAEIARQEISEIMYQIEHEELST